MKKQLQNATQNNIGDLIEVKKDFPDTISFWIAAYSIQYARVTDISPIIQKTAIPQYCMFHLAIPKFSRTFKDSI